MYPLKFRCEGWRPAWQWFGQVKWSLRSGLWGAAMVAAVLVLGGVFGLIGWDVGRWYHQPDIGFCAGLFTAGIISSVAIFDEAIDVIFGSITAFVVGVPLIYGLVLLTQIPLLVFGLITFSAHAFFVSSIIGALVGTGFCTLINLARTISGRSDNEKLIHLIIWARMYRVVDTGDSEAEQPGWLHERFMMGLSVFGPYAFLIAGLFVVPEHEHKVAAMIAFGAAWGMVFAAALSFFTVLVDRKPVRDGLISIVVVEIVLLSVGLVYGIFSHWLLEVVLPAITACAVTYGLVYLIASCKWWGTAVASPPTGEDDAAHKPSTPA